MNQIDRTIAELAAEQHGVITRWQATAAGLSASALYRRVRSGALLAYGPSTLHVPGAPLSWHGKLVAGLLDLGHDALVTGRAAAQLHGLDGFDTEALEFLVPRAHRNRTTVGCVTSTPCACRKRITAIPVIERRLDALGRQGRPGAAMLRRLIAAGAVESWLERRFLDLLRRAGLPAPVLQQRYRLADVGIVRVDFEYPHHGVVVEVGGQRGYLSLDERRRQEHRRNAVQLAGKTIYFLTREDVVDDPDYAIRTIAQALDADADAGEGTGRTPA